MASAVVEAAPRAQVRWEVADIFRLHGEAYRRAHSLPVSHLKVMRAIEVCRTAALGGHLDRCESCDFERPCYNSCRSRHCPKCQSLAKADWLEARTAELLPVGYFHNVFTIPHALNPIARCNKKVIFDILFSTVSQTLQEFGQRHLGGKMGFTTVLHTWDQKLRDHIHLHCVIPGGALSPDRQRWVAAHPGFLFSVRALSKVFRGKFIEALKIAFAQGKLIFPGKTASLGTPEGFARLIQDLWRVPWVVYSKAPFAGPEKVLDYLARYTHRIAISNHRITKVEDGRVSFGYRDRADGNQRKTLTLDASEFIRRFLLHVLPPRYVRIRHFGFLASRSKGRDLPRCRELLGQPPDPPVEPQDTAPDRLLELTGVDLATCPRCHKRAMRTVEILEPVPLAFLAPSDPEAPDTS